MLSFKNDALCWEDGEELLNYSDFLHNFSAIPLHTLTDGDVNTIPSHLKKFVSDYNADSEHESWYAGGVRFLLTTVFIVKHCMKKHKPQKVLLLDCPTAGFCVNIARIFGLFCESSQVICQTANADLAAVTHPNLKIIVSEPDISYFQREYFDVTILNDYSLAENSDWLFIDAVRVTKKGGTMLCLCDEYSEIHRYFDAFVKEGKEYRTDEESFLFMKCLDERDKENVSCYIPEDVFLNKRAEAVALLESIKQDIFNLKKICALEDLVLEIYTELNNTDVKFGISELKESVLDFIISSNDEEREFYSKRCEERLRQIKI